MGRHYLPHNGQKFKQNVSNIEDSQEPLITVAAGIWFEIEIMFHACDARIAVVQPSVLKTIVGRNVQPYV